MTQRGVVAAGHPVTAAAGAQVLRAGGNAVDAAVAAVCASFVAEPMLTGMGAGGYLLVVKPDQDPVLLDFFVAAPGRGMEGLERAPLVSIVVEFGDATQVFEVGAASCGTYGVPAGLAEAVRLFGSAPLAELTAPAAKLARRGVVVNEMQAYVFSLLAGILRSTPQMQSRYLVDGEPPRPGDVLRDPELADALDRLGADGAEPFYTGDIGRAVSEWVLAQGGAVTAEDLGGYQVVRREPLHTVYRGRYVHTNPAPSAGGPLLAYALALLEQTSGPPHADTLVQVMAAAQNARTTDFLTTLQAPGVDHRRLLASRLGSTTHISVLDAEGVACAVSCTNGEGSGISVPGTGIHLNNMMGEEDLSPLGLFSHRPGERLPSMMAPTVLVRDGVAELALGSAGSKRIRSAMLQVIVNVVDFGMAAQEAVDAPRLHVEDGVVYAEPGIDVEALRAVGRAVTPFRGRNLFFGGCQVVERNPVSGALSGGGDSRRAGAVVVV